MAQGSARLPDNNAAFTEDGVFLRQRHAGDASDRAIMLRWIAAADIVIASVGIGADDKKIVAGGFASMSGACGENRHVAGAQCQDFASFTSKAHARTALRNTENLMRVAVKMMVAEDPIAPAVLPTIFREALLEGLRKMA